MEEDYKCYLIKKNSDVEETLKVIADETLSQKILRYNDYRIVSYIEAKKEILLAMGNYFEGIRAKVKMFNEGLESDIAYLLNSFNIRHNNYEGQHKKLYMNQIKAEELLEIYDRTYFLLLVAIRGVELPKFNKEIKLLKQKYNS